MTQSKNIFLIGPMGAGKSSVGKMLARLLDKHFYDTDEEIEKITGVDLGWIFDVEGEMGFRKRETAVLKDLVRVPNCVIATGGGTILPQENREMLTANGCVVYLSVSLARQSHRTLNDTRRPLLRVKNREEVLQQLQKEREPLYQSIADIEIHTDHSTVNEIVQKIMDWYKK